MHIFLQIFPILLFLISNTAFGISDMEQLRQKAEKETFFNSIGLGVSGKSGNVDKTAYSADIFSSFNSSDWLVFLSGSSDYEEARDVKTADESFLHLRVNYKFNQSHNLEVFTQYGRNPFKAIIYRMLTGVGHRVTFSNVSALGTGVFYEQEKFDTRKDSQLRGNLYFTSRVKFNENSSFSNTLYYQPKISELSDMRILFKIALNMKITEHLAGRIGTVWSYDSKPEEGVEKSDLNYVSGITITF